MNSTTDQKIALMVTYIVYSLRVIYISFDCYMFVFFFFFVFLAFLNSLFVFFWCLSNKTNRWQILCNEHQCILILFGYYEMNLHTHSIFPSNKLYNIIVEDSTLFQLKDICTQYIDLNISKRVQCTRLVFIRMTFWNVLDVQFHSKPAMVDSVMFSLLYNWIFVCCSWMN